MDKTTFDFYIAATYPLSLPHKDLQVIHHQRINMAYSGGGGLYSCAEDMCKWARFLLREGVTDPGERLLTPESFADMCSKHVAKKGSPGAFCGLGMFVQPFKDRFIYGHTGNYDPYNSSIFVDKKTGVGVVVLVNSPAENVRYEIIEMIFDVLE